MANGNAKDEENNGNIVKSVKNNSNNIIHVENLVKKFGDFAAVDGASFSVKEGQIFAFLGPNGAGKTTTIKMLTTLLDPTAGNIRLNGFNPKEDKNSVRESFGIVFQDFSLDDELTAYENMNFHGSIYNVPRSERKRGIEYLLKLVGLWEKRKHYVKSFSGGMKKRLEIARSLLHKPKILFLDEPTAGLDPQTRNHIWEYLKTMKKKHGMTIFFTTHYMEEAEKMAEIITIIDKGKIIKTGKPNAIKKDLKAKNIEEAFLKLTGNAIRHEEASGMSSMMKAWKGRR